MVVAYLDREYLDLSCDAASGRDAYLAGLAGISEGEVRETHPCACASCEYERKERDRSRSLVRYAISYERRERDRLDAEAVE